MGKDKLTIRFDSFVDTENAEQIKRKLLDQTEGKDETDVILDMQDTVYLSSAGLRTILQLKQKHPKLSLINVTPERYEVFETTGFTQMMDMS